ncbi:hypothetical protein C7271_15675, partial [filamentous cyanobacterium CCP5]
PDSASVPEPASAAGLIGMGLLGLSFPSRKKNKRAS